MHIGHKRDGLVHSIELNRIVQEEEIRVFRDMPFHLTDQPSLLLSIYGVKNLLIEALEVGLLMDPILRAVKSEVVVE